MDFRDAYRYLMKGKGIADCFKKEGLTMYKAITLMELYNRELSRGELRGSIGIKNFGQFSSSVLMPLVSQGYVENAELPSKKVRITGKGRDLVDRVVSKL